MFYLTKNGQRIWGVMAEEEARNQRDFFREKYSHVAEWDILEVDDEEVDVLYMLEDLQERFRDYDVDMYDMSTGSCNCYVKLLDLAIDIVRNYHERRYLL